jgi:hypothetical protein
MRWRLKSEDRRGREDEHSKDLRQKSLVLPAQATIKWYLGAITGGVIVTWYAAPYITELVERYMK